MKLMICIVISKKSLMKITCNIVPTPVTGDIYNKFKEKSNENKLFTKAIKGNPIVCKAPFPKILNNFYTLNYSIPIFGNGVILTIFPESAPTFSCSSSTGDNDLYYFQIRIQYNEVSQKMRFTCIEPISSSPVEITIPDNTEIKIKFESSSDFYLTSYIVTIQDSSSTTMATYNGNRTCSSSNTDPNACLPNYFCDGGLCKECNAKCNRCSSDGSCTKCNVLSTSSSPDCAINYVNLADYKTFSHIIYAPVTSRITMGFWILLPAPQKGKSSILITDFLYLTLDIENRVAYCYVYPNLFYKYSAKINLSFDVINAKWFHITCAMSFYHKMFYINSVSNGTNNQDLQPLKHSLNYIHNTEIDEEFYFPIYISKNENLKTEFIDFENIEGGAYLKYFTIFSEYLPYTFHYMYCDFKFTKK